MTETDVLRRAREMLLSSQWRDARQASLLNALTAAIKDLGWRGPRSDLIERVREQIWSSEDGDEDWRRKTLDRAIEASSIQPGDDP